MIYRRIEHGSEEYEAECRLRHDVLRKPLGLDLYAEDLQAERAQWHFGLFDGDVLVACLVVVPDGFPEAKIRQTAVREDWRHRGLGRRIMLETEALLKAAGFDRATLNARKSALDFYRKLGYRIEGDEFIEVTIPHFRLSKRISG
ncbi:MAG TPA: GNAT family N-acetyltransferase [Burkholderiales bacterium]|nr:GNAT family N-acetyltransferase [Burkholderiales bacterium]